MLLALLLLGCGPDRPACKAHWSTSALVPGVPVSVEVSRFADRTGPSRLLGTRPLVLLAPDDAADGARITISADLPAGFTLLDGSGKALALPLEVAAGDLPLTVYVEATAPGDATVSAAAASCEPHTLDLHAVAPPSLTGRSRAEAPGFGYDTLFAAGEAIDLAFDPALEPDGLEATAYLVAHLELEGWASGPALQDLGGGPVRMVWDGSALDGERLTESAPFTADTLGSVYDVVLDVDGDGTFSAGDRLDQGPTGEGIRVVGDFGATGPHAVAQLDVSGGDWLGERVYWPEDLADLGPRPLVVISHGNGHQYTWYDYLGQHLASWGFVVMAHENETMPGIETASTTTLTNTDWFLSNLDTVGIEGLVDASRIGWIGHSRGGEGIVRAYKRLVDAETVPEAFTVDDIRVLASIAPTVFNEVNISDPSGVRYHLLAGSADGDVTGSPEYAVAQSFRLYQATTRTRSSTYIYGASHEDFDCCGADEGRGQDQLEREDVQQIAKAYLLAVMAESLDGDPYAAALLRRDPLQVPATPFDARVLSTWHDEDANVIDDFQFSDDLGTASSQAAVIYDVTNAYEGLENDLDLDLAWTGKDPMNGMTQASERTDEAAGVVFDWAVPASFGYALPERDADWSGYSALTLAACQATRDPITVELDGPLDFSVTLGDGAGIEVSRSIRPYSVIAPPYARSGAGAGSGWSNAFTTVRLPLVDFTAGGTGLDLTDIRTVRVDVGGDGNSPIGRIGLDDVEVEP